MIAIRHILRLFLALSSTSLGITCLRAQNTLIVKEVDGTQSSFTMKNIQKITFPDGNMLISSQKSSFRQYGLSAIRSVNFESITSHLSQVPDQGRRPELYPVPVHDRLCIRMDIQKACVIKITIINSSGIVVNQQADQCNSGQCTTTVDVSFLSEGLYLCRLQTGAVTETISFIIN
jgi:hypothetical protein